MVGIFSLVSVVFLAEHTVHVKRNKLGLCRGWSVTSGALFFWVSWLPPTSVHEKWQKY